jgi:tetratricopeptide (TPR) repeat protein
VDAHILLGNAYAALKKHDQAFAAFAAAKKADRASAKPYLASARLRMALGQVAGAVADIDQVTELDPGNLEGMLLQGEASMMPQKQPDGSMGVGQVSLDRARLNLETVAQKTPDNIEAQYWLAKLYEKIGQKDKAIAAWEKVGELAKGKPDAAGTAAEVAEALVRLKR